MKTDAFWMRRALVQAAQSLGATWPNPGVGCVLVREGLLIGAGRHAYCGGPHAEVNALASCRRDPRGATAYVTLEPCSHHGQTTPCAEALVAAGIGRAVIAVGDPDQRVNGRGLALLRDAGIPVELGLRGAEARALNAGFFSRVTRGRPLVTLKVATTLDGRIATHGGESQWITGETARTWTHGLRARHDALMIGINTALADDPMLTCRLPGLAGRGPVRIIMDSRMRLPLTARLVATARDIPTWLITLRRGDGARAQVMRDCGVEIIEVDDHPTGTIDVEQALAALAGRGITRLLVEGGARLAAALVRAALVDQIEWFRAASLIGGDGIPAVEGFGLDRLADQPRFERRAVRPAGPDVLETYERRE